MRAWVILLWSYLWGTCLKRLVITAESLLLNGSVTAHPDKRVTASIDSIKVFFIILLFLVE